VCVHFDGGGVPRNLLNTVVFAAFLTLPIPARALAQEKPAPAGPRPSVAAVRTAEKITVDGRLSEADWSRALPAKEFLQRDPDEGTPATEATEVRFLYDDKAIYVGARMFDSEPSKIMKRLTRRDGDTDGMADTIIIGFDALHDHLTGSYFLVTAAGSIGDGVMFNDSSDDDTWNGVWESAVSIDEKGWVAEVRIPFSQLRFSGSDRQVWGLHVIRSIQRKNEESWWAFVPKRDSRVVSLSGELGGLDGIPRASHLELLPYVTARSSISGTAEPGDPFNDGRTASAGAGLDLKWGFSSNMTMDATVNPDFGQVEVDPAVVNLTVFETFYDEKRPFFIEGSQAFSRFGRTGINGTMGFNRANPTLFYSRRIGRAPQGAAPGEFVDRPPATTVLGAAKVTGRTSGGWTVNFIDAATQREFADTATGDERGRVEVEPLTNYLATRVRRDVGQRAGFGMLATAVNRDLSDPALNAQLAGSALVVGGDGHLFLTSKRDYVVAGSFSGSRVAGSDSSMLRLQRSSARYFQRPDATHLSYNPNATSLSGWSLQSDFSRNSGNVRPNASFWAVSPGFEVNDAGYMTNADRMGMHAALEWMKPTPDRLSRRRELVVAKWNTWNFAGDEMGDGYFGAFSMTLRNYWSVDVTGHTGAWVYSDKLTRGGPMMRAPGFTIVEGELEGDERKPVVWSVRGGYETRPDGSWSKQGEFGLTFRPLPTLNIEIGPEYQHEYVAAQYVRAVTDPDAVEMYGRRYVFAGLDQKEISFVTRLNLILSPRMSLQMYLQPLLSVGSYTGFKEAAKPRTYDFLRYGQDTGTISYNEEEGAYLVYPGPGGTGTPFVIPNPDFNYTSLRSTTVFRWEFKPGSTLYVVWTQQREDETSDGRLAFNADVSRMMRAPGDNVFMVKMSYWFGR
jgi:hypothetical protein